MIPYFPMCKVVRAMQFEKDFDKRVRTPVPDTSTRFALQSSGRARVMAAVARHDKNLPSRVLGLGCAVNISAWFRVWGSG